MGASRPIETQGDAAAVALDRADAAAYVANERLVMSMLATRYADVDAEGRRELYHEAWAAVLRCARGYLLCGRNELDRHTRDQEQLGALVRRA